MGGNGSGQWCRSRYGLVEQSGTIDVAELVRSARQPHHKPTPELIELWDDGAGVARMPLYQNATEAFLAPFGDTVTHYQHIPLTSTPGTLGGRRWWFACSCGARCRKLYKRLYTNRYAYRRCQRLTYQSQRYGQSDRLYLRASKLWHSITPAGRDRPCRPKWMRKRTYWSLWQKADDLDRDAMAIGLDRIMATMNQHYFDIPH